MPKLRYYDATEEKKVEAGLPQAIHSEFLRTGKISRDGKRWLIEQRRYLSNEEVAEATGRKLDAAASTTHRRINRVHKDIRFPKLIYHRTLADSPHLGYCHVTASKTDFAKQTNVRWSFYIANFFAEIGNGEHFFEHIRPNYQRMYFAIAIEPNKVEKKVVLDRSMRPNGLLFRTQDPREAFRNVLMLGAKTHDMRDKIEQIFDGPPALIAAE